MSLFTHAGPLPTHQYVWLQPGAIGDHDWLPAVWFGLVSYPGRTWGCHVLLESGAVYRNVPLHHLAWRHDPRPADWRACDAQTWDCYGWGFSVLEYPFLASMNARARLQCGREEPGQYLFTAVPVGDAFSAEPAQAKEFYFLKLDNGRYTSQPTNQVLIDDKSFVETLEWPKFLRRQRRVWSAEDLE